MFEVYYPETIRSILQGLEAASEDTARAVGGGAHPYRDGYRAALEHVALAFGLPPSVITGGGDVLEAATWTVKDALPIGRLEAGT